MIERFIEYLSNYQKLTEEEEGIIRQCLLVNTYKKGEQLLTEGNISKAFYFNLQGCVRLYYVVDGEEKTTFFYTEGQFISSFESFVHQKPAKHNLECIEDCTLVVISQESTSQLLNFSQKFDMLARIIMEEELITYQNILTLFITMNPEQRYLAFRENHPELIRRIPQYLIASFLGVSAESLSRIKRRTLKKSRK
ncbi:MAG: Crp/Fnr family transcriptional regulator [Bacteroidota bacterium]